MIVLDEQRIFNVHYSVKRDLSDIKKKILTIAMAYLWTPYNQRNDVFNFESLTKRQKIDFLINFSFSKHYRQPAKIGSNFLISAYSGNIIILWLKSKNEIVLQTGCLNRLFVPKIFHERRDKNFLKHLIFKKNIHLKKIF